MDEVHFVNTRFDPDVIGFHAIAKEMAAAVGYTATLSVDAATSRRSIESLLVLLDLAYRRRAGCGSEPGQDRSPCELAREHNVR